MSTELTTLNDDFQAIIVEANKNKGLRKIEDPYLKVCRFLTVIADGFFKKTNKEFSGYVDSDGNESSGSKGLSIQLSVQFEKYYGFKMSEAKTDLEMLEVARARAFAKAMEKKCMGKGLPRQWLKDSLPAFLNNAANQFKEFCHE